MSELDDLLAALVAKKGRDYYAEFVALAEALIERQDDVAQNFADILTATSSTSATLGTGSKTVNVGPGKGFALGRRVTVANAVDKLMTGTISSYTDDATGALVFTVSKASDVTGSGTYTSWTVTSQGDEGDTGAAGADYTAHAALVSLAAAGYTSGKFPSYNGTTTTQLNTITSTALGLLDDPDAATMLATLGALGQGTHEIYIPAGAMWAPTTNPAEFPRSIEPSSGVPQIFGAAFDPGTQEYMHFGMRWPKSLGTATVTARFIWTHTATVTNFGVVWGISAVALSNDDALGTSFGSVVYAIDVGGTTHDAYISDATSAMTAGNTPAANDFWMFRIFREVANGSDSLGIDAILLGVVLSVTVGAANDA